MTQRVGQGGTIGLDATYTDGTGALVDPTSPRVDIIDSGDVQLVTDAVPTRSSLGQYTYSYAVGGAAPTGVWRAHWTGVINGVLREADDYFTVVAAGDIDFPAAETAARERLQRMVAYTKEPTLDSDEIDDLVALAERADQFGLWPSDPNWTPTFDLNAAAHIGWLWKAAQVADQFTFTDDAGVYHRNQIFDMCDRLAQHYRKKAIGWIPTSRWMLPWEPEPFAWDVVSASSPE